MSQKNKLHCLHVPDLYEVEEAFLHWEAVEDATAYELDMIANQTFEAGMAAHGRSWDDLALALLRWNELEAKGLSWEAFENLPPTFVVYRGPGTAVAAMAPGLAWAYLDALAETWEQLEARQLAWWELEDLYPRGASWDTLEALCLTWQEIDEHLLTWAGLAHLPADSAPHRAWAVVVPENAAFVYFRLRALLPGGEKTACLTSTPKIVNALETATITADTAQTQMLLLTAEHVQSLSGTTFVLKYDAAHLQFNSASARAGGHTLPFLPGPGIVKNQPGRLELTCARQAPEAFVWCGLAAMLCFTAKKTGSSNVQLLKTKTHP